MRYITFIRDIMLSICIIAIGISLIWTLISIRRAILSTQQDLHALLLPTQNALAQISSVSKVASQIEVDERSQFASQNAQFSATISRTNTLLDSANATLTKVNNEILPAIVAAVGDGDHTIRSIDSNLVMVQTNLQDLQALEGQLGVDAQQAQDNLSDADTIEKNSAQATANLVATTADVQRWIHTETAPIKGAWGHIKAFLFTLAAPAAEVANAIK